MVGGHVGTMRIKNKKNTSPVFQLPLNLKCDFTS